MVDSEGIADIFPWLTVKVFTDIPVADSEGDVDIFHWLTVEVLMATVRDADTLEYYWTTWRDIAGAPAKPSFVDLVELENIAATDPDNGQFSHSFVGF